MQEHVGILRVCDQACLQENMTAAATQCLQLMGQSTGVIIQYILGTCPQSLTALIHHKQAHNAAFPRRDIIVAHWTALVHGCMGHYKPVHQLLHCSVGRGVACTY